MISFNGNKTKEDLLEKFKGEKVRHNGDSMTVEELEREIEDMNSKELLTSIRVHQARQGEQIKGLKGWVTFLKAGYLFVLGLTVYVATGFTI